MTRAHPESGLSSLVGRQSLPCLRLSASRAPRLAEPLSDSVYIFVSFSGDSREICGLSPSVVRCGFFMQILVRDNNVDQALRALKKKLQREGVYREMKLRRHFEKPSEKRAREKAAAVRRARKLDRKRVERDGGK